MLSICDSLSELAKTSGVLSSPAKSKKFKTIFGRRRIECVVNVRFQRQKLFSPCSDLQVTEDSFKRSTLMLVEREISNSFKLAGAFPSGCPDRAMNGRCSQNAPIRVRPAESIPSEIGEKHNSQRLYPIKGRSTNLNTKADLNQRA